MGKKVEPAGNGAESGGGGGTLLRPPCRSYSRASCHARIGRAAGALSLRLGQNPIPLRGLWPLPPLRSKLPCAAILALLFQQHGQLVHAQRGV